jgi:hypothetical protein
MQRHPAQPHDHREHPTLIGTRLPRPEQPLWDVCCTPAPAPRAVPPAPLKQRTRLADLDPNVHCSIVGTCLTTAELRRLIPRHAPQLDRKHATDLQIHHTAVELSTDGGAVAKELNKALDARHALAIKKFRAANDEHALTRLWQEALASGDVPGAYWALMTHPAVTSDLRALAFGDVHMLSHLVGASNRADIRRLTALAEECERLREHNAHQQNRLHEMVAQHGATVDDLRRQVKALNAQRAQQPAPAAKLLDEVAQLRAALADRDRKLALHTTRRHDTEQRLAAEQQRATDLHAAHQLSQTAADTAHRELTALEQAFMQTQDGSVRASALPALAGKTIAYVGGRPGTTTVLAAMVDAAGGTLLVHDGGVEDRRGLLTAMLPGADLVVFPVDCIGHNAMQVARQTCAWHGIACHPLRSASVASFVELLQRLHPAAMPR